MFIDFEPLPEPDTGVRPPDTDVYCVTYRPNGIVEWSAYRAADHVSCPTLVTYEWGTVMTVFAQTMEQAFENARTMLHSYMED